MAEDRVQKTIEVDDVLLFLCIRIRATKLFDGPIFNVPQPQHYLRRYSQSITVWQKAIGNRPTQWMGQQLEVVATQNAQTAAVPDWRTYGTFQERCVHPRARAEGLVKRSRKYIFRNKKIHI